MRTRSASARRKATLLLTACLVAGTSTALTAARTAAAAVPDGFTDTAVITGLEAPTNAVFAPDGRLFIGEKGGRVKTYDSLADTTATITADLRTQTQEFWDRGLLGLALDPSFPTRPYLYVLYTHDAEPGGTAPRWGDQCPTPPGATDQGCVVTGRLSRLTIGANGVATAEQVLLTDWCQQFPSHSIGSIAFGADGAMYVGAGDGASFNFADWGQRGNPCADPPGTAGVNLSPPNARGGALRTQSVRRPAGEPVSLDGTIARINPDTGAPVPGNPFASNPNVNAQRIVAYGMRNPFRFTFRPGTNELWAGDVGWNTWEEINRIPDAADGVAENFGWPCYEGTGRQSGYDGADLTQCESLYGTGQTAAYYAYHHDAAVAPGDGCATNGSSISGLTFETNSNYPAAYDGALFFSDSSRGCIWAMGRGSNGLPNPATVVPFVTGASAPVQLLTGPGGDLFYVAIGTGELRRVSYVAGTNRPPNAVVTANPTSGNAPLTVQFNGSGSSDPDGGALTYAWDLDADGAFDDSTEVNPAFTYLTQGQGQARLRVTDPQGLTGTAGVTITIGNPPSNAPAVSIDNPTAATQWSVGQTIPFAGRAADAQDGDLPASALSWQLTLQHCSTPSNCHAHQVQSWQGISSGSFIAPDHEYPSFLDLTLKATDSDGNTATRTVRLNPRTVTLTFTSNPNGARLVVGTVEQVAPFTRTVIVGSANTISAPSPQRLSFGLGYQFRSWSDGGARSHTVTAPATATTYRANFQLCLC